MTTTDVEQTVDPGRALAWSLANTALTRFGTLAIGVALARLLGPAEFGTFAVAMVALMAVLSFNELGVSLAIVRWERDPAEIAPTVATISTAMSAALTLGMVLAAPSFAEAMGAPDAALAVQLMSLSVLINGVVATPAALLQRDFRQRTRTMIDQTNTWSGAAVSLVMALLGLGAMSLVAGRLVGSALSALLFLKCSPRPLRFGWDPALARLLLAFGLPLAGSSIIVFLVGFLDQLVVGRLLGPVQLGYYVLAVNLASWPLTLFSQPLRMIAPALFSRMQADPARMTASFGHVLRPLAAVAIPASALIAVASPQIIHVVYGEAWADAAPVLRWLAVLTAARILFELSYDFLVVRGRSRGLLLIHLAWVAVLVPAVWWGVRSAGIDGAAAALVVVALATSAPLYVAELSRSGIRVSSLARALAPPVVASVLLAGAVLWLLDTTGSSLLGLLLGGAVLAPVAASLLWRVRADLGVFRRITS